jgi:hypothetical protein
MERAVIAKALQEELQALGFHDPVARRIIDHQHAEIGLARDRADRGEFRRGEAHEIERVRMWVGNALQLGLSRASGNGSGLAELGEAALISAHGRHLKSRRAAGKSQEP